MVRSCGEKDYVVGLMSIRKIEVSGHRKTRTEVERCYTKMYEGESSTEKNDKTREHGERKLSGDLQTWKGQ